MKICILIPVYNEAEHLGLLIDELKGKEFDVLVVDDGSTDASEQIAGDKGVFIIRHSKKEGKGKSLQDGFKHVLTQGYDAVITMDGDRQHDVLDIDHFVKKAQESEDVGVVVGSRMANHQGMPFVRLLTNRFMSWIISLMCRQSIPDTQCGFRLIRCDTLKNITLSSSDFEIETELLIEASRAGYRIHSVPIKTIYRNELSKINPVVDTIRFLRYILRQLFRRSSSNR